MIMEYLNYKKSRLDQVLSSPLISVADKNKAGAVLERVYSDAINFTDWSSKAPTLVIT